MQKNSLPKYNWNLFQVFGARGKENVPRSRCFGTSEFQVYGNARPSKSPCLGWRQ
ncbi:eyes absent 4 homolog (Drosophila), isoform CRA_a [Mus musculus]|nr:eyes absent 4 homolog (Drosophila), isoform CRA_a [Mus musculus]